LLFVVRCLFPLACNFYTLADAEALRMMGNNALPWQYHFDMEVVATRQLTEHGWMAMA